MRFSDREAESGITCLRECVHVLVCVSCVVMLCVLCASEVFVFLPFLSSYLDFRWCDR